MISLVSVRVYFVKDSGSEKMVWRFRSVQRIFSLFRSIPNSPFLRVDMVLAPFVMGFVWVVGTDFIMSILYHAAMILAILYQPHLNTGMQTMSHLALFSLPFNQFFKSSIYDLFNL